jgi:hypothetical protein
LDFTKVGIKEIQNETRLFSCYQNKKYALIPAKRQLLKTVVNNSQIVFSSEIPGKRSGPP